MPPEIISDREPKRDLTRQFVALDQAGVLFPRQFLFELEVVIPEADRAHPRHADHCDQDVAVVQACPEESAGESRPENDESAHRRSSSLLLMCVGRSFANNLVQPHTPQPPHDSWADNPGKENRAYRRACGAKSYPLKQSQKPEVRQSYEWNEQIVQHYAVAQVVRCGTRRSSCTLRDALSNMIALRCSLA